MDRNPGDTGAKVYNLDAYRIEPTEFDHDLARRHRLFRRRAAAVVIASLTFGVAGVALANTRANPLPVYCGYAITEPGQGGVAIADAAAHSQHLPRPNNETAAGTLINKMHPYPGQRYVMWISSDSQRAAHIMTDTIQRWPGLENPCPQGPLPMPVPLTTTSATP